MSALIILLIPLALYFFMIRPQRQRVQAQRALVDGLGPGDRVVTAGGMVGTLVAMDGEQAAVEVAPGLIVEFLAPAIVRRAPGEHDAAPGEHDAAPGEHDAAPGEHGAEPVDDPGPLAPGREES
jgi:preprotein translocase subunit YajC